jgi:hypothetical protein
MDREPVPDRHRNDIFDMIKTFNVGQPRSTALTC